LGIASTSLADAGRGGREINVTPKYTSMQSCSSHVGIEQAIIGRGGWGVGGECDRERVGRMVVVVIACHRRRLASSFLLLLLLLIAYRFQANDALVAFPLPHLNGALLPPPMTPASA